MAVFIDHYSILGLPSGKEGTNFSNEDIKKAYRSKALELHPDKRRDDPNAVVDFQQLQASYEILKDENTRKEFDNVVVIRVKKQKRQNTYSEHMNKRSERKHSYGGNSRERWRRMMEEQEINRRRMMEEKLEEEEKELDRMMANLEEIKRSLDLLGRKRRAMADFDIDVWIMKSDVEGRYRRTIYDPEVRKRAAANS